MLEQIQQARRHVDALRVALESPSHEEIDQCLPRLEAAVECLRALEKELMARAMKSNAARPGAASGGAEIPAAVSEGEPEIGRQLLSLRNELDVAQRLVIHGSAFYESWGRMLRVAAGGYMPSGEAAALDTPGSLSVKG